MERLVVHLSRFERETSAFGGQRSIQLSYRCIIGRIALSLETRNQKKSFKQLMRQFQRLDQPVGLIRRVIDSK
jgi:uncharacterized protein YpiB (UPF0302 family)